MDRPGRVLFRRSLSLHVGCLRRGPVVQIVGDLMTLAADRELASALDGLRQTRAVLRRTPKHRAPRNYTLTPKMAGIRPPVPRSVPALSWAAAAAALLFLPQLPQHLPMPVR